MEGNFEGNGINIRTVTYGELEPYEKELLKEQLTDETKVNDGTKFLKITTDDGMEEKTSINPATKEETERLAKLGRLHDDGKFSAFELMNIEDEFGFEERTLTMPDGMEEFLHQTDTKKGILMRGTAEISRKAGELKLAERANDEANGRFSENMSIWQKSLKAAEKATEIIEKYHLTELDKEDFKIGIVASVDPERNEEMSFYIEAADAVRERENECKPYERKQSEKLGIRMPLEVTVMHRENSKEKVSIRYDEIGKCRTEKELDRLIAGKTAEKAENYPVNPLIRAFAGKPVINDERFYEASEILEKELMPYNEYYKEKAKQIRKDFKLNEPATERIAERETTTEQKNGTIHQTEQLDLFSCGPEPTPKKGGRTPEKGFEME